MELRDLEANKNATKEVDKKTESKKPKEDKVSFAELFTFATKCVFVSNLYW